MHQEEAKQNGAGEQPGGRFPSRMTVGHLSAPPVQRHHRQSGF
jgi:hypothetical protein